MKPTQKRILLYTTFIILGFVAGYLYWTFIGCRKGTCPITANWHTTSLYGGLIGYLGGDALWSFLRKKRAGKAEV